MMEDKIRSIILTKLPAPRPHPLKYGTEINKLYSEVLIEFLKLKEGYWGEEYNEFRNQLHDSYQKILKELKSEGRISIERESFQIIIYKSC